MHSPTFNALMNPFCLATLAIAAAAGLCSSWWLFPLGLLVWALMVVFLATDPSLRINYEMEARAAALSPRFQQLYNRVVRSQVRIFNTLGSGDGRTRRALESIHSSVDALTDQVYALCQRMTGAENYMKVTQASTDLQGQRALLVLSLDGIADPVVKRQKEDALKALDNQIQQVKNVSQLLDRVDAQVTSAAGSLDAILVDIVRLQALGADQAEKQAAPLLQQLQEQIAQLKSFESEIVQAA